MKRSVIALLSLAALAIGAGAIAAQPAGPLKIGVVNVNALMQQAPQMQAAQKSLEAEFGTDERELIQLGQKLKAQEDKLTKEQSTMSQTQVQALDRELREGVIDLEAKQQKVQERLNTRRQELLATVQRAVLEETQKYAVANTFDLVLADGVLFASNALDITAPILEALKVRPVAAAPTAAPAPAPARPATR